MHDIRAHRPINDCLGRNAGFPGFVQYKLYCLALCSPARTPPLPFLRSVTPLKIREFMRVTFYPITPSVLLRFGRASLIDGPPFVLGGRRY